MAAGSKAEEVANIAQLNVLDMLTCAITAVTSFLWPNGGLPEHFCARQTAFFAPTTHLQLTDPQVTAICRRRFAAHRSLGPPVEVSHESKAASEMLPSAYSIN